MISNWPKELIGLKKNLETLEPIIICGVYFLMSEDEVVYIGSSIDVHSRVRTHFKNIGYISKVYILPLNDIETSREKESLLIKHFKPTLNFTDNSNAKRKKPSKITESHQDKLNRVLSESTTGSVNQVLSTITEKEERVIRYRYKVDGSSFMTLRGLGLIYGLTHERIRQIQVKAERKLLHPTRLKIFIKKYNLISS